MLFRPFSLLPCIAGAVLLLASLSAAPAARAECTVTIGVIAVLSGPGLAWGEVVREGAAMAAEEYNVKGGIKVDGAMCHINYVAIDSKYSGEGAASAANQLAGQGIKFVIGPVGANEVPGVKPVAVRNGMLVMANSHSRTAIGPQWPLVFHFGPGPSAWADPIIQIAKTKFNIKKVMVTAPNDQGGTEVGSVDAAAYKKNGIEATEDYYERGTTNFAPLVQRLLNAKPDAIELASTPPNDAGVIIKQLRQAGFDGPIGRLGGPSTQEIVRVAGSVEVVKNMFWFEPIVRGEGTDRADETYRRLFKKDPPANTLFYEWLVASRMVMKAIEKAGTVKDTQKVAQVLRALPVEDPDMGQGLWIGQEFFGINQELSFPYGAGFIIDGKYEPLQKLPAATGK